MSAQGHDCGSRARSSNFRNWSISAARMPMIGWLLLAQSGGRKMGRACLLCPGISDINLFRYCRGIVHFDPEIPDRAFDLGVAKQKLDSPEVARSP